MFFCKGEREEELGITQSRQVLPTCYGICMQQPVKRNRKTERNLSIKKMRTRGKRLEEIAQYFGITRQRVYQILKV